MGEVSDVFGGDSRTQLPGLRGKDDIAIQFLRVGGGLAASPGLGPKFGGAAHGGGVDGLKGQHFAQLIQSREGAGESFQQKTPADFVVHDFRDDDADAGFEKMFQPSDNFRVAGGCVSRPSGPESRTMISAIEAFPNGKPVVFDRPFGARPNERVVVGFLFHPATEQTGHARLAALHFGFGQGSYGHGGNVGRPDLTVNGRFAASLATGASRSCW